MWYGRILGHSPWPNVNAFQLHARPGAGTSVVADLHLWAQANLYDPRVNCKRLLGRGLTIPPRHREQSRSNRG
jgi:hypothetical protein